MNMHARFVTLRADAQVKIACANNLDFMRKLKNESIKLIVTSPPYNIGKSYERRDSLENYILAQRQVIAECVRLLHPKGSTGKLEIMCIAAKYFRSTLFYTRFLKSTG